MTRLLLLLPLLLVISGCTNPYSQFYTESFMGGKNILDDPTFIIPTDNPKLIAGTNIESDSKRMLGDNYRLLGQSSFNSATVRQDLAIQHAKKIHADTVITYSAYTNTVSGSMPMTVPNTQTSYHSGSIYGSGAGSANYFGSSTTYGSTTTYMPYHIRRYDYYASFWVKANPPRLGICFGDLSDELRKKVGSNKGIYILAVVKGSPAFNSDLLTGDVIRRVNGIEVIDKNFFWNWLNETHPSIIEFEIFRNGENISKKVQLRS